jgi:hypothetical protein
MLMNADVDALQGLREMLVKTSLALIIDRQLSSFVDSRSPRPSLREGRATRAHGLQ